jgi:hypothetical protein
MVLHRPVELAQITGQWQITGPKAEMTVTEIAAGAIGLARLAHFDTQLRRSDLLKTIQVTAYSQKHAFTCRFAEELRD